MEIAPHLAIPHSVAEEIPFGRRPPPTIGNEAIIQLQGASWDRNNATSGLRSLEGRRRDRHPQ
jgi:hypothetical protein